mgnify:CR=1 FL=1
MQSWFLPSICTRPLRRRALGEMGPVVSSAGNFSKVFCIGFNKTGTSTLHRLFVELGLSSWHGYYSHIPVVDPIFSSFQCFSDGERHDFGELDRAFPGSRFILTTRPFEEWLTSRIRHVERRRSLGASGPMRQEYDADPRGAVEQWIRRRLDYHARARDYFEARSGDLLVINVCNPSGGCDAVASIAAHLGLAAPPNLGLPHENANAEGAIADGTVRTRAEVRREVLAIMRDMGLDDSLARSEFP